MTEEFNFYSNIKREKGDSLVGLVNLGETCFLNAIVVCMYNIADLRNYVIGSSSVTAQGVQIVKKLFRSISTAHNAVSPSEFVGFVTQTWEQYQGVGNQEDAMEFLAFFLAILHDGYKEGNTSIISQIFSIEVKTITRCRHENCNYESETSTGYNFLSLEVPNFNQQTSLKDCLATYFMEENVDDSRCELCRNYGTYSKRYKLGTCPHFLIIHLKRFIAKDYLTAQKNHTEVQFGLDLDLSHFANNTSLKYELVGVVNHLGTLNKGHYISYIKTKNRWYEMNDSKVTSVTSRKLFSSKAYILLYKRHTYEECENVVEPVHIMQQPHIPQDSNGIESRIESDSNPNVDFGNKNVHKKYGLRKSQVSICHGSNVANNEKEIRSLCENKHVQVSLHQHQKQSNQLVTSLQEKEIETNGNSEEPKQGKEIEPSPFCKRKNRKTGPSLHESSQTQGTLQNTRDTETLNGTKKAKGITRKCISCSVTGKLMHTFPSVIVSGAVHPDNLKQCRQWVKNSGCHKLLTSNPSTLHNNVYLCTDHFEDKQYMNKESRKRLHKNAIPTIFECEPINESYMNEFQNWMTPLHLTNENQMLIERYLENLSIPDNNGEVQTEIPRQNTLGVKGIGRKCISCSATGKLLHTFPRILVSGAIHQQNLEKCRNWVKNSGCHELLRMDSSTLNGHVYLCCYDMKQ